MDIFAVLDQDADGNIGTEEIMQGLDVPAARPYRYCLTAAHTYFGYLHTNHRLTCAAAVALQHSMLESTA